MGNFYLNAMVMNFASFLAYTGFHLIYISSLPVTKIIMIFFLLALVIFTVFRIKKFFQKKQQQKEDEEISSGKEEIEEILKICKEQLNDSLMQIHLIYTTGINSFLREDITNLKAALGLKKQLNKNLEEMKKKVFLVASDMESSLHSGHYYVELNDYQNRIVHSVNLLLQPLYEHLNNSHKPFLRIQEEELKNLGRGIRIFFHLALNQINDHSIQMSNLVEMHTNTTDILGNMELAQIQRIKSKQVNTRNSVLYLNTITETKNMLNHTLSLVKTYKKLIMA